MLNASKWREGAQRRGAQDKIERRRPPLRNPQCSSSCPKIPQNRQELRFIYCFIFGQALRDGSGLLGRFRERGGQRIPPRWERAQRP